jgi:hypothetical protein
MLSDLIGRRWSPLSTEERISFVDELNRICEAELLYQARRFPDLKISSDNQSLFRANATGESIVRQNRVLLEEAYPWAVNHDPGNWLALHRTLATDGTIESLDSPIHVGKRKLERSRYLSDAHSDLNVAHPKVIFITENIIGETIDCKPAPAADARLLGETRSEPSCVIWGSAKWELRIHFAVHNGFESELSIYDVHAEVYHVSADRISPAMMVYRPRIELIQDNSILTQRRVIAIPPHRMRPIELAFETSVYDARDTTIVFGTFVDWHVVDGGSVVKRRTASDNIYVFEHESDWADRQCRVSTYNEADLNSIQGQDPSNEVKLHRCNSLRQILKQHFSREAML